MKKTLTALVALGALALAGTAFAQIAGSAHDLSDNFANTISACEFCHTPHNSNTNFTGGANRMPLWNRTNPATSTFTAYGTTVAGTNIVAGANTPGTNSLTCLSCHDGVSAMNSTFTTTTETKLRAAGAYANINYNGASYADVGKDLRNDHPIGFVYVADRAGVPASVYGNIGTGTGPFRLYGSTAVGTATFECASCHDPHDTTTGGGTATAAGTSGQSLYFLRAPHASICTDCHQNK